MTPDSPSYFHYHACAQAFSARFRRPFDEHVDVQAPTSLPVTGGHGSARVENFRFHEFISFKKAYTHVSGGYQEDDKSNNTLVTSVIEGLNMMDVLTIDRVVCRLYSKHPKDAPEGNITMHGSRFENVSICGHPVKIDLDFGLFENLQTFRQARDAYKANGQFTKIARDPLRTGKALPEQDCHGAFLCSLVKESGIQVISPAGTPAPPATFQTSGHAIYVPGFGKVYFAETFMTHGQRTLSMLRFDLGSTSQAAGVAAAGTTNGKQWPPT